MRNEIGKIIYYMYQIRFQKPQVLSLKQEHWEKGSLIIILFPDISLSNLLLPGVGSYIFI